MRVLLEVHRRLEAARHPRHRRQRAAAATALVRLVTGKGGSGINATATTTPGGNASAATGRGPATHPVALRYLVHVLLGLLRYPETTTLAARLLAELLQHVALSSAGTGAGAGLASRAASNHTPPGRSTELAATGGAASSYRMSIGGSKGAVPLPEAARGTALVTLLGDLMPQLLSGLAGALVAAESATVAPTYLRGRDGVGARALQGGPGVTRGRGVAERRGQPLVELLLQLTVQVRVRGGIWCGNSEVELCDTGGNHHTSHITHHTYTLKAYYLPKGFASRYYHPSLPLPHSCRPRESCKCSSSPPPLFPTSRDSRRP